MWQYAALGLGSLAAAEVGWAWLDARIAAPWLHRTVILMAAAIGGAAVVRLLVAPRLTAESDWRKPCRHALGALAGVAAVSLAAVLVQEVVDYQADGGTPMAWPAIATVGLALLSLAAGLIATALSPAWDPLRLSERGRTAYVYAAEAMALVLGVHLRLTVPELFQLEIIRDYWMLLILVVAFLGAGLSELFARRGVPVLGRPLEYTALLLPLVPAVAFWLPLEHRVTFGLAGATPALWLLAGLFYGLLAYTRRSLPLAGLAVLASNVGLWIIWHRVGLGLLEHPQLWLIPPALAVLAAEHLNRKLLTPAQGAAVRYVALCVVYVSSTSEFLRELGSNWYLPLVLVGLSVAGIVVGLLLRARSFLLVGVAFLLVVIVSMIWDAAFRQHHMWVFWVSCIVLGTAIIALFGYFEKNREQMLAALARFRGWQQ